MSLNQQAQFAYGLAPWVMGGLRQRRKGRRSNRRHWKIPLGFLILGFASAASGCSGEADESASVGQRIQQPSGFCQEWAGLVCTERVVESCAAASPERCAATQQAHCLDLIAEVDYNPDFGEFCLAAARSAVSKGQLDAEGYAILTELGGDCDYLGSAGVELGGSCQEDFDCDPIRGLVCAKADAGLGVCAAPEVVSGGFECGAVAQRCEAGFYCDGEDCLALRGKGQSCDDLEPCSEGLKCRDGHCIEQSESGSGCELADDCLSGLCAETGSDGERLCVDRVVLSVSEPVCRTLR